MKVKDIMTPSVEFIKSDASVKEAALKMEELDVGVLPVVIGSDAVGIVTDRDIVIRSVAQGLDPEKTPIMQVVSEGVESCGEDEDIGIVAEKMKRNQIRRILVRNNDSTLSGIVSLGDLALNAQKDTSGEVLQKVSQSAG